MKIFLDANVLVSVLNEEYPVYSYSSRVLSLAGSNRFKVYTSPLCLAIAFYYAQKKNKRNARDKVSVLANRLQITCVDEKTVTQALRDKRVHDLEDGMQYYSALEAGCVALISEDGDDFYFSEIEVLKSREFMTRYVF